VGPGERSAQIIRDRVREVLADPGYRRRVAAFAGEMRSLPAVSDVVQMLERLAVDHRPILRA
jgi:UDP:flavonoid glycosyltransferase YjiC (YdhE family)